MLESEGNAGAAAAQEEFSISECDLEVALAESEAAPAAVQAPDEAASTRVAVPVGLVGAAPQASLPPLARAALAMAAHPSVTTARTLTRQLSSATLKARAKAMSDLEMPLAEAAWHKHHFDNITRPYQATYPAPCRMFKKPAASQPDEHAAPAAQTKEPKSIMVR